MVNYKTRVFCEPEDGDSLGAEVRIYGEDGEKIDTILITTESQYQQLATRIENIDDTYIDINELQNLLGDTENNTLNINATTLGGFGSDSFAKLNHTELHQGVFAPVAHDSTSETYGLGSSTKYGHVKTIDNLTTATNISGEALSAHQGKVLNEAIASVRNELLTWSTQKVSEYGVLQINRALRLCSFSYYRTGYNVKSGTKNLHKATSIKNYAPPHSIMLPWQNFFLKIEPTGDIDLIASENKSNTSVIGYAMWKY